MKRTQNKLACLFGLAVTLAWCAARANAAEEGYKKYSDFVIDIRALGDANTPGPAETFKLVDGSNAPIWTEVAATNDTRRRIWCFEIHEITNAPPSRKVLVTGTHHAREWVAYRAVWDASQFIFTNRYETNWNNVPVNSRFTEFALFKEMNLNALVTNAHIFMIPIVNPSGYYYSMEVAHDPVPDDSVSPKVPGWRKNRTNVTFYPIASGEPSGAPLIGVDLNRNYPSLDWGLVTHDTNWVETTSRWRWAYNYCGKPGVGSWTVSTNFPQPGGPAMERETEGIVTLSTLNQFDCHIDVHSYGPTVGWVPDANPNPSSVGLRASGSLSDSNVLQILAAKAASVMAGGYTPEATPYPTSGDTLVWQYQHSANNCLPFLIEIGSGGIFRPADPTAHAEAVLPGQLFMMFAAVDRSFSSKPTARFRKP